MNNESIKHYLEIKAKQKELTALEKKLRVELLEDAFGENNAGTLNTMYSDYSIKGGFGINLSLDRKGYEEALDSGVFDGTDVDSAVDWKPALNKRVYESLDEDSLDLLNEYITAKPALPTLEIKIIED